MSVNGSSVSKFLVRTNFERPAGRRRQAICTHAMAIYRRMPMSVAGSNVEESEIYQRGADCDTAAESAVIQCRYS
jgi:hypothetical protein